MQDESVDTEDARPMSFEPQLPFSSDEFNNLMVDSVQAYGHEIIQLQKNQENLLALIKILEANLVGQVDNDDSAAHLPHSGDAGQLESFVESAQRVARKMYRPTIMPPTSLPLDERFDVQNMKRTLSEKNTPPSENAAPSAAEAQAKAAADAAVVAISAVGELRAEVKALKASLAEQATAVDTAVSSQRSNAVSDTTAATDDDDTQSKNEGGQPTAGKEAAAAAPVPAPARSTAPALAAAPAAEEEEKKEKASIEETDAFALRMEVKSLKRTLKSELEKVRKELKVLVSGGGGGGSGGGGSGKKEKAAATASSSSSSSDNSSSSSSSSGMVELQAKVDGMGKTMSALLNDVETLRAEFEKKASEEKSPPPQPPTLHPAADATAVPTDEVLLPASSSSQPVKEEEDETKSPDCIANPPESSSSSSSAAVAAEPKEGEEGEEGLSPLVSSFPSPPASPLSGKDRFTMLAKRVVEDKRRASLLSRDTLGKAPTLMDRIEKLEAVLAGQKVQQETLNSGLKREASARKAALENSAAEAATMLNAATKAANEALREVSSVADAASQAASKAQMRGDEAFQAASEVGKKAAADSGLVMILTQAAQAAAEKCGASVAALELRCLTLEEHDRCCPQHTQQQQEQEQEQKQKQKQKQEQEQEQKEEKAEEEEEEEVKVAEEEPPKEKERRVAKNNDDSRMALIARAQATEEELKLAGQDGGDGSKVGAGALDELQKQVLGLKEEVTEVFADLGDIKLKFIEQEAVLEETQALLEGRLASLEHTRRRGGGGCGGGGGDGGISNAFEQVAVPESALSGGGNGGGGNGVSAKALHNLEAQLNKLARELDKKTTQLETGLNKQRDFVVEVNQATALNLKTVEELEVTVLDLSERTSSNSQGLRVKVDLDRFEALEASLEAIAAEAAMVSKAVVEDLTTAVQATVKKIASADKKQSATSARVDGLEEKLSDAEAGGNALLRGFSKPHCMSCAPLGSTPASQLVHGKAAQPVVQPKFPSILNADLYHQNPAAGQAGLLMQTQQQQLYLLQQQQLQQQQQLEESWRAVSTPSSPSHALASDREHGFTVGTPAMTTTIDDGATTTTTNDEATTTTFPPIVTDGSGGVAVAVVDRTDLVTPSDCTTPVSAPLVPPMLPAVYHSHHQSEVKTKAANNINGGSANNKGFRLTSPPQQQQQHNQHQMQQQQQSPQEQQYPPQQFPQPAPKAVPGKGGVVSSGHLRSLVVVDTKGGGGGAPARRNRKDSADQLDFSNNGALSPWSQGSPEKDKNSKGGAGGGSRKK